MALRLEIFSNIEKLRAVNCYLFFVVELMGIAPMSKVVDKKYSTSLAYLIPFLTEQLFALKQAKQQAIVFAFFSQRRRQRTSRCHSHD